MVEGIVILNIKEIPHAAQLARTLKEYKVYIIDPVLIDLLEVHQLTNFELIRWDSCPSYPELEKFARDAAFATEKELDLIVRERIPEVSIFSWQYLNLYYLFLSLKWYGTLWNEIGHKLVADKLHIFFCNQPMTFFLNSFIPSVVLSQYLVKNQISCTAYNYGDKYDHTNLVPNLCGSAEQSDDEMILTHLPSCYYDRDYFNEEIRASGKFVINIKSKIWDVPVLGSQSLSLAEAEEASIDLPDELREKITKVSISLSSKLDSILLPYLSIDDYRHRQVKHFTDTYASQLTTYYLLNTYFQESIPTKIVLSEHDAGFHGPIVSFAQKHHLPILMLPHSYTIPDIEFKYPKITALVHPVQASEIFDGSGKDVLQYNIAYPNDLSASTRFPTPIKTISLLLNALTLSGIYFTRCNSYIDGIKKIVEWCKNNEIELKIRCKPHYTLINLLAIETGADRNMLIESARETLEEHVASCDLSIMYDAPTNAGFNFLNKSIPILNAVVEPLSRSETRFFHQNLVPQGNIDEILERVKEFKSDPVSLFSFRNTQFSYYMQLLQNAKPLRTFL